MKTKRVLLFQEDGCAPDARESFEKRLKEKFGLTLRELKEKSNVYNYSSGIEWYYENIYVLSFYADDPFYKLEQIVVDSPHG